MLKSISWLQFFKVVGIGTLFYYGWFIIRFYSKELQVWAKGEKYKDPSAEGIAVNAGGTGSANHPGQAGQGGQGVQPNTGKLVEAVAAVVPFKTSSTATKNPEAPGAVNQPSPFGQGQPALFNEKSVPAGETPELFKVMERVIDLLKKIINEAEGTALERDVFLDRVFEILSSFHHLRRTQYQVAINNFLTRSASTSLGWNISEEELKDLWS